MVYIEFSKEVALRCNGIGHWKPIIDISNAIYDSSSHSKVAFVQVASINVLGQSLQWRHDQRDGVSNHRRLDCLPNRLFMRRSKKTSKLRTIGLCEGNPSVTAGFPSQRASNAQNVPFDDVINGWKYLLLWNYENSSLVAHGDFLLRLVTFCPADLYSVACI